MANTTCCTWITISRKVETKLHKIIKQANWLKGWLYPLGFSLMDLGTMALKYSSNTRNYLAYGYHNNLLHAFY